VVHVALQNPPEQPVSPAKERKKEGMQETVDMLCEVRIIIEANVNGWKDPKNENPQRATPG
jgi:hypothetical protein